VDLLEIGSALLLGIILGWVGRALMQGANDSLDMAAVARTLREDLLNELQRQSEHAKRTSQTLNDRD
jgi:hypothetical protein